MARGVLTEGRLLDAARMIEPLLEQSGPDTSARENSSQIMLRCLMARVHLLRSGDSSKAFDLLKPFESSERRATLGAGLRAEVALWLGWARAWQDDHLYDAARALNLLDEAEQAFRLELNPTGRCWALIGQAQAYFTIDEYQLMLQALHEAAALQATISDVYAEAWLCHLSVTGARFEGRYNLAHKHADRLEEIAGAHHDELCLGRAFAHNAVLGYEQGRQPDDVIAYAERAERALRTAVNPGYSLLSAYHAHVGALIRKGEWDAANRVIDACLNRIGHLGTAPAYITLHRARILNFRGQAEHALGLLDEISARIRRQHRLLLASICRLRCETHLAAGASAAARMDAQEAYQNAHDAGHVGYALKALLLQAQIAVRERDAESAQALIRDAENHAEYFSLLPLAAHRFLIHGQLSALRARDDEARVFFTQALSAYSLIGDAFSMARIQLEMALQNGGGGTAATRNLVQAARETFEKLGAVHDMERASQLLNRLPDASRGGVVKQEADIGAIMARAAVSVDLVAEAWLQAAEALARGRWLVVYRCSDDGSWTLVHKHGDVPADLAFPDPTLDRICERGVDWMRLRGLPAPAFFFGMECGGEADPACAAIEKRLAPWIPVVGLALEHALLRSSRLGGITTRDGIRPARADIQLKDFVFASPAMRAVVKHIHRIRSGHSPALIVGESGVGKGRIARAIHEVSDRSEARFVNFSCSNDASDALEGMLTGDGADDRGMLSGTALGTLYLEEISELSLEIQPRLLHFLESGGIPRYDRLMPVSSGIRIVASTKTDLQSLVRDGRFLEELYYRLNVVPIRVPPLRERREEIPLFVHHFLRKLTDGASTGASITSRALDALIRYDWPGNVRQLRNEIERLILFAASEPVSTIDIEDLSLPIVEAVRQQRIQLDDNGEMRGYSFDGRGLDDILAVAERSVIEHALTFHDGQVSSTAEALGLSRQGLYKKMKRLGIDSSEFQSDAIGSDQSAAI